MSTLAVDNLKPSAGGTEFGIGGVAKAWLNFTGTGTVTINKSLNVASVTDRAQGDYNTNYTNTLIANDFAPSASHYAAAGVSSVLVVEILTTYHRNFSLDATGAIDSLIVTNVVMGDLA